MGRAARNVNGKVFLFADKVSSAMQTAIDETNRRRRHQLEYNETHQVVPTSITKEIRDIAQGLSVGDKMEQTKLKDFDPLEWEDMMDYIVDLEEEMKEAARNLEFEKAAKLRDQITEMKKVLEGE
jgi:excinuclease ABC subunit B